MSGNFFFADISNFTKTTEMFIKKTQYGPEVIRDIVDSVFNGAIEKIYENNGYVILFAGDGLLFCIPPEFIGSIRNEFEKSIDQFNEKMSAELGIKIEEISEPLFPHIVAAKTRNFLYFHPQKSSLSYENVKSIMNLDFPPIIGEMKKKNSHGELRVIPAGFINISEDKTPEDLTEFFEHMISEADREQIYVNKIEWADKGWMVLFACGLPVSVENAPLKLLHYMEGLMKKAEDLEIRVKAGCTLGKGYAGIIGGKERWEYTFIGGNINLAARIAVKAEPGNIFCEKSFSEELASHALFERRGDFQFKGIEKNVEVFSFKDFTEKKKSSIFVGRDAELEAALKHLSNKSSCLIVSGEGGIGKTHFIDEVLKMADSPYVNASCSFKKEPYYLLMRILMQTEKFKECIDNFGSVFIKTAKIQNAKDRFIALAEALTKELIIAVDDSQYIDAESLDLINWIFFESNGFLKFIFVGRDVSNLSFVDSKLSKFASMEVKLKGFSKNGVSSFLENSFNATPREDDVKEMTRISDGNPLFLSQIVSFMQKEGMVEAKESFIEFKSKLKDFPYSLKELILVKFDKFPSQTKEFVETGSVIGEEFANSIAFNSLEDGEKGMENAILPAVENRILSRKLESVSMFYHSIVKQTIFDRMLKKRIDEICVRVGDEMSKNQDNGYMLLQAGDFYAAAKNDKASSAFLKATEKFLEERNPVYSSHSLKKVLKESAETDESLRALRLFPEISAMHLDMELLELAYEKCSKLRKEMSEREKKSVESVAWGLVNLLRDYSRGSEMLDMYGKISGEDYSYLMLKAKIAEESENLNTAFNIYENIKKNIKMTLKEEFDYLTAVSALIFFKTIKREELKKNLRKLAEKQKKLRDDFSTMHYYGLIISIYLHTNELEKAEKFAKLHIKLAKKHKQMDSVGSIYNNFAIINSNKFFLTGEKKYERKALRYHKKVFDTVKKDMRMNDMPLMVTNLGNSYMAAGDAKNCMKCFYEGLLYGQEIDHPVEVPYNMILIMLFIYERGGYSLGYKLADAAIDYKYKIDISTTALILKYLKTKEKRFHDEGVKMAKELLGAMNTPPYQMYLDVMFNHFYRRGDAGELLKIRGKIEQFTSKTKLREVSRHKCMMMMAVADIENDRISPLKAATIILKEEKRGMKTLAQLQLCFSLGKMLERKKERKKAIQFMLKSLKISKRLCYFNYSLMIEEHLADIGYRKKHFRSESKREMMIINEMENLKTIEDFALWFERLE